MRRRVQYPTLHALQGYLEKLRVTRTVIDLSADAVEILKLFYKHALILKKPLSIGLSTSILADLLPIDASIITGYGEPFYNSSNFAEPMGNMLEICDHDFYLNFEHFSSIKAVFIAIQFKYLQLHLIAPCACAGIARAHEQGAAARRVPQQGEDAVRGGRECRADRKSTRLNSSHTDISRMPSSA